MPASSLCPPPQAYANWNTFTSVTQLRKGETAFETVKRFRVAEVEKNRAGQRLWGGIKACRQEPKSNPKEAVPDETIADIFSGGLQ